MHLFGPTCHRDLCDQEAQYNSLVDEINSGLLMAILNSSDITHLLDLGCVRSVRTIATHRPDRRNNCEVLLRLMHIHNEPPKPLHFAHYISHKCSIGQRKSVSPLYHIFTVPFTASELASPAEQPRDCLLAPEVGRTQPVASFAAIVTPCYLYHNGYQQEAYTISSL